MNTLKDHTILYDDECPLCNLYTSGFVKSGMLDDQGRERYSTANPEYFNYVDRVRACNEIALIDKKNKQVYYGLDSLLKIIGNSLPVFNPLFTSSVFRAVLTRLYAFISYNRKVIIPGKNIARQNSCVPTFNLKYRILYLLFTWVASAIILNRYSQLLTPYVPAGSFTREFAICGGQILFQALVMLLISRRNVWTYLGNMMTISFGGSLLLFLGALAVTWTTGPILFAGWFAVVVALMFLEHVRRMKLLALPVVMSATWVLYRVLVLFATDVL